MKKSYCDCCETEITKENRFSSEGFMFVLATVEFSLKMANAIPCDFDVCKYCVIDAAVKLDDRPKEFSK